MLLSVGLNCYVIVSVCVLGLLFSAGFTDLCASISSGYF